MLNFDNALAGKALLYLDSKTKLSGKTDGFAQVSADGQRIELRPALPRQWADLYTTWNMVFKESALRPILSSSRDVRLSIYLSLFM